MGHAVKLYIQASAYLSNPHQQFLAIPSFQVPISAALPFGPLTRYSSELVLIGLQELVNLFDVLISSSCTASSMAPISKYNVAPISKYNVALNKMSRYPKLHTDVLHVKSSSVWRPALWVSQADQWQIEALHNGEPILLILHKVASHTHH